jgi:hypothetical protein
LETNQEKKTLVGAWTTNLANDLSGRSSVLMVIAFYPTIHQLDMDNYTFLYFLN